MSEFEDPQSSFENEPSGMGSGGEGPPVSDDLQSTFADEERPPEQVVLVDRTWQEIWQMAITSPTVSTYREIMRDRNVDVGRAALWLYAGTVVGFVMQFVAALIVGASNGSNVLLASASVGVLSIICTPILAAFSVAILMIFFSLVHVLARFLMGGKGDYAETVFAIASFYSPMTIILGGLSIFRIVPVLGIIAQVGAYLYIGWLGIVAMRAAHSFGWIQGVISWLTLPMLFVICIIAVLILALAGESTNEIFENIVNTLEATPGQ